jgi:hypothetical protein
MISAFFTKYITIGLIGLIAILGIYGAIQKWRYESAVKELAIFKQSVHDLAITQQAKNSDTRAKQAQVTSNVVVAYSDAVTKLKDYYNENPNVKFVTTHSVFDNATSSGTMPTKSEATSTVDASSESVRASTSGVKTIKVEDCASDVLQLLSLQRWETEQGKID